MKNFELKKEKGKKYIKTERLRAKVVKFSAMDIKDQVESISAMKNE